MKPSLSAVFKAQNGIMPRNFCKKWNYAPQFLQKMELCPAIFDFFVIFTYENFCYQHENSC
jgi:hypothetical protein